jgi:hypothetical protein
MGVLEYSGKRPAIRTPPAFRPEGMHQVRTKYIENASVHVRISAMQTALAGDPVLSRPSPSKTVRAAALCLMVAAWAAAVVAGIWVLWRYANRPGPSGAAASAWPADTGLRRDPSHSTLIMFIHPRCPCSRASVEELDTLLARAKSRPSVKALFIRPAGMELGWERQALWSSAAAIPGVETSVDSEGVEARRFGVETSGHVLLFGPDGSLRYSGGITAARGHSGDNAGLTLILDRLRDAALPPATAPVFGCLLFDDLSQENEP